MLAMWWLIREFGGIKNMVVLLKERNELANATRNVRENTTATGRRRQEGFWQHYLKTSTQTQRYHHSNYYILIA
jgi:hypothetical protein